jgi:hypothetical protein
MDRRSRDLVRQALRDLHHDFAVAAADWDVLLRQARVAGLLARLATGLRERGLLDAVPPEPRQHLESALLLVEKLHGEVHWELKHIKAAFGASDVPIVLLKGAAYVMAGLPPARGRLFNDIDILVPLKQLSEAEGALVSAGWHGKPLDAYDRHYYREWMHQIPPLTHIRRHTTIDVHHTIVARTTRLQLEPEKLFAAAVPVPGEPRLKTLSPADMVLHSATHLLNEGDFNRGLRDLDDINLLLRHFENEQAFWPGLIDRAAALDLQRPLYYALRYTKRFLGTPVPEEVAEAKQLAPRTPALRALMDLFFERALRSTHPGCRDWLSPLALHSLYIRGHLLLMPPHLLVPHLIRKSLKRAKPIKPPPVVQFDP